MDSLNRYDYRAAAAERFTPPPAAPGARPQTTSAERVLQRERRQQLVEALRPRRPV
jgi:hypothetical protein